MKAASSETIESTTTYTSIGSPGTPEEESAGASEPEEIGTCRAKTRIRHTLDGSTVSAVEYAAIVAQRGTPGTGW